MKGGEGGKEKGRGEEGKKFMLHRIEDAQYMCVPADMPLPWPVVS